MTRLLEETSLLLRAMGCVVVLVMIAVDVVVKWGGEESLVMGPVMTWWGGIMCSLTLPFLVVEYRHRRSAKHGRKAVPPAEEESAS